MYLPFLHLSIQVGTIGLIMIPITGVVVVIVLTHVSASQWPILNNKQHLPVQVVVHVGLFLKNEFVKASGQCYWFCDQNIFSGGTCFWFRTWGGFHHLSIDASLYCVTLKQEV